MPLFALYGVHLRNLSLLCGTYKNNKGYKMDNVTHESKIKKTRNRKKILTETLKTRIEPKYKELVKDFCEKSNITISDFIREAIIDKLEFYEWIN